MLKPSLPYAHLNLRRNPFGELDLSERGPMAVAKVDDLVEALRRPGFAVQFIDRKGRGKTSHLLAIRCRFPDAPYVHVGEGKTPRMPHGHPLFLDECQRIPRWKRRRLFARRVSFVIATHESHEEELIDAGLAVKTVRPSEQLSIRRLHRIFRQRIERVRRGPGALPRIREETIGELVNVFGDDIRGIESFLYEKFQAMKRIGDV